MMKQDAGLMTLKKRLSLSVATIGFVVVSSLAGIEANAAGETAPPPGPLSVDKNYPPVNFDPEKNPARTSKSIDAKQPSKAQHQWPNADQGANQGAASSKEYPPQGGIDLTPPPKAPVAKPVLKYPAFPSVPWPKEKAKGPEKDQKKAPAVATTTPAPTYVAPTDVAPGTKAPANSAASGNQSAPEFTPPATPTSPWGPPPKPWGQPVWQPPGQVDQAPQANQAETDKALKDRQVEMKRQWEAQQAEMKNARAAYQAYQAEQEKALRAQQAEMKQAWEAQQAEMQKQKAEMEADILRQRKMMEAQMAKQRAAMKAEIAIMRQQAKMPRAQTVPPLPPKASQPAAPQPAPQQVAPQPVVPQQAVPQQVVPRQAAPQRVAPQRVAPYWQYQNRRYPAWGYNPYWPMPNRQMPSGQWQRPYPYYGPGYYQPR